MRRSFVIVAFLLIALTTAARELPTVRIHGASNQVVEGNAGLTEKSLTVVLSFPAPAPAEATYQTVDGTATAQGNDYVPTSGQFFIPQGETTSPPIVLQIVGDKKVETNETFLLVVDFITGASDPPPYVITIVNDDTPTVTVNDVRVTEGNSGTTAMKFDVTMTSQSDIPVDVDYQTAPGTATAGVDYLGVTGALTFTPGGATTQSVTVLAIGDIAFEPDETFTFNATPKGGAKATGTGTIANDDTVKPAKLNIVSGNNQQGRLGQRLAQPLVVQLVDDIGGVVPGTAVQWRVSKGQATFDTTITVTDAQGRASTGVTLDSVGVVEVEASAAGFTATFTLGSATSFESRAQGPVAVPIGRTLDSICARNTNTFAQVCRALSVLSNEELTPTLERVAPQQSGAQSKVASEVISAVTSGISSRLTAVRAGTQRFSVADLSLDWHGRAIPLAELSSALAPMISAQTDAGGSDDNDYNGWSAFLSGNLGSGERKTHPGELGFDLKSRGLMAGVDRMFGQSIFGVSLNLMKLDTDLSSSAGSVDIDGWALSLYGSHTGLFASSASSDSGKGLRYDGMHIDGSITAGSNQYESEHIVDIAGMPLARATSKNDGDVLAVAGVLGWDAHNGRTDFDASLSGTWSRAKIDDLTEEGSGPLILFVEGHDIDSLTATAAFSVKTAWPVSFGTLLPNFRAELIHEFEDSARLVTAHFVRDELGTSFTIPIDQPDANYAKVAAGLQASFAHGFAAYIEATQDIARSDLKFRTFQFILTKSF